MDVGFLNAKIREICEVEKIAIKKYGKPNKVKIFQRVAELRAADNLADFRKVHARTHQLTGDMKGEYPADLVGPARLIFLPNYEDTDPTQLDEKMITEVTIMRVEKNYHKKS